MITLHRVEEHFQSLSAHLLEGDTLSKRFTQISDDDLARWEELKSVNKACSRFDPCNQSFKTH